MRNNPFPIKSLKERRKQLLNSEEGKKLKETLDKEFLDFVVFGKTPYYGDVGTFGDLKDWCVEEYNMTAEDIVETFKKVK